MLTGMAGPLPRQGLITRRCHPVAWRVMLLGLQPAGQDKYASVLAVTRKRLTDQVALRRALLARSGLAGDRGTTRAPGPIAPPYEKPLVMSVIVMLCRSRPA